MLLEIDDDVLGSLVVTGEDFRLALAFGLFLDRRITLGRAADVAGMTQAEFLDQIGARGIPLHYDPDDVELDLRTIDQLRHA